MTTTERLSNLLNEVLNRSQEVGLEQALEEMEAHLQNYNMDRMGVYALMLNLVRS